MQTVIDISKEMKNRLSFGVTYSQDIQAICEAIGNSTPLPEVLDKIRAEIMKLDDINPDYPMDRTIHISRNDVLQIINKHKEDTKGE